MENNSIKRIRNSFSVIFQPKFPILIPRNNWETKENWRAIGSNNQDHSGSRCTLFKTNASLQSDLPFSVQYSFIMFDWLGLRCTPSTFLSTLAELSFFLLLLISFPPLFVVHVWFGLSADLCILCLFMASSNYLYLASPLRVDFYDWVFLSLFQTGTVDIYSHYHRSNNRQS